MPRSDLLEQILLEEAAFLACYFRLHCVGLVPKEYTDRVTTKASNSVLARVRPIVREWGEVIAAQEATAAGIAWRKQCFALLSQTADDVYLEIRDSKSNGAEWWLIVKE
jgi:hypothetical protein